MEAEAIFISKGCFCFLLNLNFGGSKHETGIGNLVSANQPGQGTQTMDGELFQAGAAAGNAPEKRGGTVQKAVDDQLENGVGYIPSNVIL